MRPNRGGHRWKSHPNGAGRCRQSRGIGGVDALIDRRGKRKSIEEMSEVDKLKLENKILKAKYRRIELENALLKKLNELEGV